MAIGPVQLLVLGFENPDFHGEILEEIERLRESDAVRIIDALAVYKDAAGDVEVAHISNLTREEAIELGSTIGALLGLGIDGEEGALAGAEAGAEAAAGRHQRLLRRGGVGHHRGDPQRLGSCADPARASLGRPAARRHRPRRRVPHQRRLHQPGRPDRHRPAGRGRGRGARPGAGRRVGARLAPPPEPDPRRANVRRTQSRPPHEPPGLSPLTPHTMTAAARASRGSGASCTGPAQAPSGAFASS